MENKKIKFPENFLWGASTSSHQIEGGLLNNWSEWEKKNASRLANEAEGEWEKWQQEKFPEMFEEQNYISDQACDSYNRFEEDFSIAKELGHNAHRFSLEWSRIEPKEGEFDEKAILHYREMIQSLHDKNMEPFVVLWHWTYPVWLEEKGGLESRKFPEYFRKYTSFVVDKLGDIVDFWITINEPTSVIAAGYIQGKWPPQKKSIFSALSIYKNLSKAHIKAYDEIHSNYKHVSVGFANILQYIEPYSERCILDRLTVKIAKYFSNEKFLKMTKGKNDFLTAQYYFHNKIRHFKRANENKEVTDLGWEIYPEGIYHVINDLKKYNLPIYVTENGLADKGDEKREKFIREHLFWINKAIQDGADVRGYFYWSLLDNFEWDKGFWPKFGLVEIDFETKERKVRPSALKYAQICKENEVELENVEINE